VYDQAKNHKNGSRMTKQNFVKAIGALMLSALCIAASGAPAADPPIAVKVMIINMFGLEAAPFIAALKPQREIRVPGLSSDYPLVRCTAAGVCEMTTGMGHASAAASMTAVILSHQFDLRRTYFLIAGIAGIDPAHGTIGAAAWARYVVDADIAHEIDAREMPKGWLDGYFGTLTDGPGHKPQFDYRTELFQVDEPLLQKALSLSRHAALEDSDDVAAYRKLYPHSPANAAPAVTQCDTASGDIWWGGRLLGERETRWTRLLTDGHGVYCTTQQEDNATFLALTRGAESGLTDIHHVLVLRTGSDFDRPYPGQSALEGLIKQRSLAGAGKISTDNLARAGMPVVEDIVAHWDTWQAGVPK
jgi:purine nucleoside permease